MRPSLSTLELGMNKTERAYADYLFSLKLGKEILDYQFEPLKFKLAQATFYTPDFMLIYKDRFEFHEVKGFMRDDAAVKLKVVAKLFPWFRFVLVTKSKDGLWQWREIKV